nr:hypothetical protein [Nocardia brasiliensis]
MPTVQQGTGILWKLGGPARADGREGGGQLVVGGGWGGQAQVLAQGVAEDMVFLGDQDDLAAQPIRGEPGDRHTADGDRTLVGCLDPGDQPSEGGFACTGGPDDGEPFAGPDIEVDTVQDTAAVSVGEMHAGADYSVIGRLGDGRGIRVGSRRSRGGDSLDSGECGSGALDLVQPHHEQVQRIDQPL